MSSIIPSSPSQTQQMTPDPGILCIPGKFPLELGSQLEQPNIYYETWGKLNAEKDNVIWVCHALTGNAEVGAWWLGLFGYGKCYSPEHHFIVCANVLGSCYGTTGPLDCHEGQSFHDFPKLTIRDMVRAHIELRKHLKIRKIHTLLGGSLGGQQALEWAIIEPDIIERLIPVATNAFHSPWGIAFNEAQRMAIRSDPTWSENHSKSGLKGLKTARAIAMLSYRTYSSYEKTQFETEIDKTDQYLASSYQVYMGEKLARRFNAFTYYLLSQAMDSHHVGRGRGGAKKALSYIQAKTLVLGLNSDILFPVREQKFLAKNIPNASFAEIRSSFGHDGFLKEGEQIGMIVEGFG